jgi:small nuclear ribonucleoprotein (snRNP)-like protein
MRLFYTMLMILLAAATQQALGQNAKQVNMHLKNGAVIRGRLLEVSPAYRLETYDKSIWVFQKEEVDTLIIQKRVNPNIQYKKKGFVHYTELGPLAMSNRASNGVTTSAFSFQTTNGYKFNQWVYTGLGIGADLYAVQTFVPVVLSLRGDFTSKGSKIPFYFLEGGYGFNATSNDVDNVRFGGGATFSAGLGLKLLFNDNTGFVIGAGYRFQRSSVTQLGLDKLEDFNRLTLRAGFSF